MLQRRDWGVTEPIVALDGHDPVSLLLKLHTDANVRWFKVGPLTETDLRLFKDIEDLVGLSSNPRDGTRVAVGDMDVEHLLRNTLRMIIRNRRESRRILVSTEHDEVSGMEEEMTYFQWKDSQDARRYCDLANPNIFFPLLEGGVHGSLGLQQRHGKGVFDLD